MESTQVPAPVPEAKPRTLVLALLLVLSLFGLGAAGLVFRGYAAEHLRPTAKMPRCVMIARRALIKSATVSGSEPFPTPEGEVFVTPRQLSALSCAQGISKDFAAKLALALAEEEPERSAISLVNILKDAPRGPEGDREATAAFILGQSALRALPDLPEVKAASDELSELHACRFATRKTCPTRPAIPMLVWIAGGPSAALFLVSAFMLSKRGIAALLQRRRAKKAKANAPAPQAQSELPPSPSDE